MKKTLFFENAKLIYEKFGIVPLMYGSIGLEYLTGENLCADDIDILIPDIHLNDRWGEFETFLSSAGYNLYDEDEHTFCKDGVFYSYASLEELESFAGIRLSDIEERSLEGIRFRLLSLQQYLEVYDASSKDGYRINIRKKKDYEKITFIKKRLENKILNVTVIQPKYFSGENPDRKIAEFLLEELEKVPEGGLIVAPEYSNAGGLSDAESELAALPRAEIMLEKASEIAARKKAYVVINVLQHRDGQLKNSTYLFDKSGKVAFIYNKQHLPPSEIKLGMVAGNPSGKCECLYELDGIKFAFMTCYDVYFNEQIEHIAKGNADIILIPGYQRGERTDIICAQAKLLAFRCNAYVARSSYSMDSDEHGGCSMIVAPDGKIIENIGSGVGSISADIDPSVKYMRAAGYGQGMVKNNDFISAGLCPEAF